MSEEGQLTKKDSGVQYAAYVSGKKVFQKKEKLRTKLRGGICTYENVSGVQDKHGPWNAISGQDKDNKK